METNHYTFLAGRDFFLKNKKKIEKKFLPQLSHFCKNGPDKGGGGSDGDGENFLIGNFAENEMACSQHV